MLKKLLLATSVAAITTGVNAASWDENGLLEVTHTDQGIENSLETTGVAVSGSVLVLGTEYAVNDRLTFTSTVAKGSNVSWPSTLTSIPSGTAKGAAGAGLEITATIAAGVKTLTLETVATNIANQAGVVVGDRFTLENDSTATVYRVTSIANPAGTILIEPGLAEAAAVDDELTFKDVKTLNMGYVSGDATSATYRVTSLTTANNTTVGASIATPEVNVSPSGLIANDAKWTFASSTEAGTAIETLATASTYAVSKPQFAASVVTKFDGIIDVENTRYQYTASTTPVNTGIAATKKADTFTYKIQETLGVNGASYGTATVTALNAAETKGVLSIAGDFSYLDDNATTAGISLTQATDASHVDSGAVTTQDGVVAASATALTVTCTGAGAASCVTQGGAALTNSLDLVSTNASAELPVTTFAPTFTLSYDSNVVSTPDKTMTFTMDGGKWALNGANITAYGVPMGDTVSRFLWLNNKGATAGDVTAVVTSGGTRYPTTGEYALGSSAGKTAMQVGTLVDTALSDAGVTLPASSRANITFSVPVKDSDVTLSAAYKHIGDADRLTIETSDTTDGTDK